MLKSEFLMLVEKNLAEQNAMVLGDKSGSGEILPTVEKKKDKNNSKLDIKKKEQIAKVLSRNKSISLNDLMQLRNV